MPVIELRTLGALDLHSAEGRELNSLLAQPKRIALLAYLCIAQPRGFHRRDTLLGLFWPDSDQEHARTSLRKSLHILRRSLGDDAILSRGDEEVAVDFQLVWCDTAAFEASVKANRLEEALDLYRGDLLAGFFIEEAPEFDQWLYSERTRLRASAARAAFALSEQIEAGGNVAAAVILARRALEFSDTDERAAQKLIDLQARVGDRTGAIQTYETFARHLATEYGTDPSAQTQSLIEGIRSGKAALGSNAEANGPANRSPTLALAPEVRSGTREAGGDGRGARRTRSVGIAVAVLIFGTALWRWMPPTPSKPVLRYTMAIDSTEAMVPSTPWSGRIAISPDGSRLAYIGGPRSQLLIRPLSQLHAIAVPGTEGAATPFFSPDGEHVGFLREGIIQIASVSGGPPITVSDSLTGVAGASWGPDNFIYSDGSMPYLPVGLVRVEAKPGAVPHWFTTVDTAGREVDHSWPDVLPNGKGVLFTVGFSGRNGVKGGASYAIAVADIPSGKRRVILEDAMYARYATPGYLLYVTTNKSLMVVPFDQNSMKIAGEPTALTEGMRLGHLGSADLAVSATGTLLYATGAGDGKQELVWVTRDGKEQAVDPDWAAFYMGAPMLSPDGKSVAVARIANGEAPASIWIKRLDRGPSSKLTVDTKDNGMPVWTPDGKSVTFTSTSATGVIDLWTQRADGSAQAVMQFHGKSNLFNPRWSPDAKWLIFQTDVESPGSGDILAIRPGIDTAPVPVVATRFTEISPVLSPDGRWLAYVSNETGRDEIYVVPFPNTGTAKWAISAGGGTEPVWSHRGKELFYRDASWNLVAVGVNTKPTFSLGRDTVLFPAAGFSSLRWRPQYSVALDDRRFLMVRPLKTNASDKLIFVQNWVEELKGSGRPAHARD
jgi:DNA-binding SARP family transcriptional activator